jgi:hypothetical protein
MNSLDAARQLIRYALEEQACWVSLHSIVEDERARLWPESGVLYGHDGRRRVRFYDGPKASVTWDSRRAAA